MVDDRVSGIFSILGGLWFLIMHRWAARVLHYYASGIFAKVPSKHIYEIMFLLIGLFFIIDGILVMTGVAN